jgi:hypothetical protein
VKIKQLPKKYMIQAAVPRSLAKGFVLACEPKLLDDGIAHAITMVWRDGDIISEVRAEYSANSICMISNPELSLVKTSPSGNFSVQSREEFIIGNIFRHAKPPSEREIYGSIHGVYSVAGKAYAVGFGGIVYRMDTIGDWSWIGEQLPESFDIAAIDGFSETDIYACGLKGALWHFDGETWRPLDSPTKLHLQKIRCTPEGAVYAAGAKGMILKNEGGAWRVVDHGGMDRDIWGLEYFAGKLYVSTFSGVFTLEGDKLEPVDFDGNSPQSTHKLAQCLECIWSVGDRDIVSFDGQTWSKII